MVDETPAPQEPQAEEYLWVVVNTTKEDIEIWSTREKAQASIEGNAEANPDHLYLYHVAADEMTRAFPNRPVCNGDQETDTKNRYIRKGWDPGTK